MDGDTLSLRTADAAARSAVEGRLADAGLPTDDVRDPAPSFFLAVADGEVVGVGGLETHGTVGLLRSVAVDPAHRGRGYGTAICDRLEARAAGAGVETLYLLTTDATGFFADRGYEPVDRDAVPPAIAETRQFASLCPDSAVCLCARL